MRMFEPGDDPPHNSRSLLSGDGVWSALANTERWISNTLEQHAGTNPYVRKEVSYVCETTDESIMAVGNVFRRVREARELGESFSKTEESIVVDKGPDYEPGTLRQTQVVVIPWCDNFKSFQDFEATYQAINTARRSARDYVTDISLEKLAMEKNSNPIERDWVVSLSLSSLHPEYGTKTMVENLTETKNEELEGDVDLNLEEYKKRRNLARQSPYPTLVLEVKATPPPDFGSSPPPPIQGSSSRMEAPDTHDQSESDEAGGASKEDLNKLEALFGLSPATSHKGEDSFYDSIGQVIEEVSVENPVIASQTWLTQHDPMYDGKKVIFTTTDAKQVDAAYEVIFTSIAAQKPLLSLPSSPLLPKDSSIPNNGPEVGNRSYVIMPNFLSSSATSFWKFSLEVSKILGTVMDSNELVSISIFHPEHVDEEKRCPLPTFGFQWSREEGSN